MTELDQLTALRDQLQSQTNKLAQKLAEAQEKLKAVTLTLSLLRTDEGEDETNDIPLRELHGMTQIEALIHLARANNNRVKTADAKRLLTAAGVMRDTKNSYGILYTVINRSGRFRRADRGEYELLPDPPLQEAIRIKAT